MSFCLHQIILNCREQKIENIEFEVRFLPSEISRVVWVCHFQCTLGLRNACDEIENRLSSLVIWGNARDIARANEVPLTCVKHGLPPQTCQLM